MSDTMERVIGQITQYLGNGGFFNPEYMNHEAVRDLLMDCRTELQSCKDQLAAAQKEIRELLDRFVYD